MYGSITSLEIFRWGFAHLPGAIFYYAKELELDPEDIGLLATIFYAFENIKPLFQSGVSAGQVLKCCPAYSTTKLSKRLSSLSARGVVGLSNGQTRSFVDKTIYLEPLMDRLEELIVRDHPQLIMYSAAPAARSAASSPMPPPAAPLLSAPELRARPDDSFLPEHYRQRVEDLESQLAASQQLNGKADESRDTRTGGEVLDEESYRKIADFISKKTGNLISPKMGQELKIWLRDLGFKADFLLIMLELCFERKITNPREIGQIAAELKKYAIGTVEGLDMYFKKYIDADPGQGRRQSQFDPEIMDFGSFVGVDMGAEARRKLYYKWRLEWKLDRSLVMKAGELMCQRTSNGGLEYIDSVLADWKNKGLTTMSEVEAEIAAFKKNRKAQNKGGGKGDSPAKGAVRQGEEYSVYVPPELLASMKKAPAGS